jgi:hypothetical protein
MNFKNLAKMVEELVGMRIPSSLTDSLDEIGMP